MNLIRLRRVIHFRLRPCTVQLISSSRAVAVLRWYVVPRQSELFGRRVVEKKNTMLSMRMIYGGDASIFD